MSAQIKAATSLGAMLRRAGGSQTVRSALAAALRSRGIRPGTPGSVRGLVGARGRRRSRGITATELRGFRKVANLLNRYFRSAPAAMKRKSFGKRRR